jgi:hypothetical protein
VPELEGYFDDISSFACNRIILQRQKKETKMGMENRNVVKKKNLVKNDNGEEEKTAHAFAV